MTEAGGGASHEPRNVPWTFSDEVGAMNFTEAVLTAIVLSATFGGFLSCMYLFGLFGSRGFAFFDPAALACLFLLSLAYYICGGIRVLAACLRHEAERWRQRQQRRRPHFD